MPASDFDYEGVPTAADMEATLLPEPDEMYAFRNAFQVDTEAPNRDGDSVEYPSLDGDFEGDLVEIEPDETHPEAKLDYDGLTAAWQEYGFKFRIRKTDVEDSKVNIVVINQREMNRETMRRLDAISGAVIENNRSDVEVGDDTVEFNYDAAVDLETELIANGYDSDRGLFILSPRAWGGMAKSDDFVSQTERFADEFRSTGIRHGELLGLPAIRSNVNAPFMDDNDAYLVDTGVYGWESPRRSFGVEREYKVDDRAWFYHTDGRIDWVPTEPDAAVKAIGGVPEV